MKTDFRQIRFATISAVFFALTGLAAFSQTVNQITNFLVTTLGAQFKFDVNGQDTGQSQGFGVNNSPNFSLNAGARYVFA